MKCTGQLEQYVADVLTQMFPKRVEVSVATLSDSMFPLYPVEEHSIERAVAKRRIEFATGRHCARLAMTRLVGREHPIPSGPDRAPIWPCGLIGSITHDGELCVAAVASRKDFISIGIDIEVVGAAPTVLAKDVLLPDELTGLEFQGAVDDADWLTLHFCLKEAAYKAFYQIHHRFVDFHEMRIVLNLERQEFSAQALVLNPDIASEFHGRFHVQHGKIYAACWPVT